MNNLSYPGLERIKDQVFVQAFRMIWDFIRKLEQLIKDPASGTLNPDQKPISPAEGDKFFSTDFNRLYRFTGGVWEDDVTAPSRFQVSFFAADPEPLVGWAPCDGSSTLISTSYGAALYFITPVIPPLNGLLAWIRL